ncbi:GDSL esterase/lipase [Hibiscus syriacus]|uniref:GDSL esterase/lipase n=1 Tax=Hibiscus syriacus TaxID=106335 RepID=A0A6A2XXM7_HIBSY|nr:GDSL esterase/lipase At5g03610-like [Hibiscus syriacus]XP_039047547.1 GDSL esterase/lipase At5g03610-like [Hibiscus syriacus]KAE8661157.1 GDSL esterase/lipase [Hibiscus syriacus]
MDTPNLLCSFFFFFSLFLGHQQHVVGGSSVFLSGFGPKMMFVFGDSYADTGNNKKTLASSWKIPYGITFPGKPAGRFSDGRVLTDYVAGYLRVKTPIPYRWRKQLAGRVKYGMNFAYGGTGVFDTLVPEPNMSTQIDFLQQLLNDSVYSKRSLKTSVALVSLAGNDYSNYLATNGSAAGFPAFIGSVVNQLKVNLKRIHDSGVRKIAVSALQPLGCLPRSTALFAFEQCNGTENMLVELHNQLLVQAVNDLDKQTNSSSFFVLDIYNAFWDVFNQKQARQVSPTFENPFEPCCAGVSAAFSCGSVDENGVKKYTVCWNPKLRFFWDTVHPTQEGWRAVYSTPVLQNNLKQIW